MSAENKKIFLVAGLVICVIFGWVLPLLWVFYIIGIVMAYRNDGKLSKTQTATRAIEQPVEQVVSKDTKLDDITYDITQALDETEDEGVREGLERALDIIKGYERYDGSASTPRLVEVAVEQPTVSQPIASEPSLTQEQSAEQAAKREQDNINIMLYVASFLLVGAAVIFIGTSLPELAKFIGLCVVMIVFYSLGLALHTRIAKLGPAARAFVGTGLALVPFVGLALHSYVLHDAALAWWLTSIAGLAMFFYALVVMRSTTLGYFTIAFVFSLATSSVAVLSAPFVWYFLLIILVGSGMQYFAYKNPSWLPMEILRPMEETGQLTVPLALIGSIITMGRLRLFDYELISAVIVLHYGVHAYGLRQQPSYFAHWSLTRVFGILGLVLVAYDVFDHRYAIGGALALSSVVTHWYALRRRERPFETMWLVYAQLGLFVSSALWMPEWSLMCLGLALAGGVSWHQMKATSKYDYGIGSYAALVALPYVICERWIVLGSPHYTLVVTCLVIAIGLLVGRLWIQRLSTIDQRWLLIAHALLMGEAVYASLLLDNMTPLAIGCALSAIIIQLRMLSARGGAMYREWLGATQVLMVIAITLWWGQNWNAVLAGLGALFVMSMWQLRDTKTLRYGLSAYAALLAMPIVYCYYVLEHRYSGEIVGVLLAIVAVVLFCLRLRGRATDIVTEWSRGGYPLLAVAAIIMAMLTPCLWVSVGILILGAGLLYASSHVEREPYVYVFANLLLVVAIWYVSRAVGVSIEWQILSVAWACSVLWYGASWYFESINSHVRRIILVVSTLSLLFCASIASLWEPTTLAAWVTIYTGACIIAVEGYYQRRTLYYDIAIVVATVALQAINGELLPNTHALFYTHWWAASIGTIALLHLRARDGAVARPLGMIALAIVSLPSALWAIMSGGNYQLLFLIEHVALLGIGIITNKKYLVRWTAACIGIAVLWMLRGYTYVLLGLLGIALLALAIWRLMKR